MKKKYSKNSGFTLVETLIAISIFSMTIVTMMSILGNGISDITYAKNKMLSGYLAQEGIEYVRNQRDNDILADKTNGWAKFVSDMTSITDPINNADFPGFTRVVGVEEGSPDSSHYVRVFSTVTAGKYNVTFRENLYNWVE